MPPAKNPKEISNGALPLGPDHTKNLKIQLARVPFARNRQFYVKMNGQPRPKDGGPVSLTRLLTALRKSLLKPVQR